MTFLGDLAQRTLAPKSSLRFTSPCRSMSRMSVTHQVRTAAQPGSARLGERVRQLRVAAGLTQTDLAGERFSKEYVSQIERGKTRPTRETIEWLAAKLGVDAGFLEKGVSADERSRVEAMLARAEALANNHQFDEAVEELENSRTAVMATGAVELEARATQAEAWARMERGELRPALQLLERCRTLTEGPGFSGVDRAQVLFRMGVCRYRLSSRAVQRGAQARGGRAASVRPAALRDPRLALAVLPPPARPRGGARGRRARARAGAVAGRPPHDGERLLPGLARLRADGPLD